MATNCSTNLYTINFTDNRKDHILVSKGELITDKADIAFVGKTNRDYGEIFDENTLHLLENFACPEDAGNPGNPDFGNAFGDLLENPIEGQVWFNTTTNRPFRFDGVNWISLSTRCDVAGNYGVIAHGESLPRPVCPITGYVFPYDECTWVVSPFNYANKIDFMRCGTDVNALVTMEYRPSGSVLIEGLVNYQIIGVRGNLNQGSGGGDPLPITPTPPAQTPPTVTSPTHTNVSLTTATLGGNVTNDGGATITQRGTVWGLSNDPTTNDNIVTGTTGIFTGPVSGLPSGTLIYYRAYATNSQGTAYSVSNSFTTTAAATIPTVTDPTHTAVTNATATLGGNVASDGGDAIIQRGTLWATTPNPIIHNDPVAGTTGVFTGPVLGLPAGTLIYYRAYATNSIGTAYSADNTFTTGAAATAPSISQPTSVGVANTTATLGANITSDGGAAITQRGIVWGTSAIPTGNDTPHATNATGIFSIDITGLPSGTLIYFRGYATNSVGTSYTADGSFTTTVASGPPIIFEDTFGYSNVTSTSAIVHAQVISDGGAPITDRGAVWALYPKLYPDFTDNIVSWPGTTGTLDVTINGLPSDTDIYYSLYATNANGSDFTNQLGQPFHTSPPPTVPTVTSPTFSDVTDTTATLGANVTAHGGYAITSRGIKWGTSPNPTGNTSTTSGTTGVFTLSETGLPAGTLIYFRGFATNFLGTGYSSDGTFTTLSAPTVTTPTHTDITDTTSTLGANVTSDGGTSITSRGIVWGLSTNPTGNVTPDGVNSTGVFTVGATGMPAETLIYYRGYATNSVGTSYSITNSFTTTPAPTPDLTGNVDSTSFNCHVVNPNSLCFSLSHTGSITGVNCLALPQSWLVNGFRSGDDGYDYTFTASITGTIPASLVVSGPLSGNLGTPQSWCIPSSGNDAFDPEQHATVTITITGPAGTTGGTVSAQLFTSSLL